MRCASVGMHQGMPFEEVFDLIFFADVRIGVRQTFYTSRLVPTAL